MKKFSLASTLLGVVLMSTAQITEPAHICIDLGGVLLTTNKQKAASYVGMGTGMRYYMSRSKRMAPDEFFFHTLEQMKPYTGPGPRACYGTVPLPQISCDWLKGTRPNKELLQEILTGIKERPELFANKAERNMVEHLARFMLDPVKFASTVKIIPDGLRMLKACYKEKDARGERKHKIYIVSNWDAESFALLRARPDLQQIWNMCDGIFVSGELHCLKPEDAFYKELKKSMRPEEEPCILVDDQPENIDAGKKFGFYGIYCKSPRQASTKLRKLGIIS